MLATFATLLATICLGHVEGVQMQLKSHAVPGVRGTLSATFRSKVWKILGKTNTVTLSIQGCFYWFLSTWGCFLWKRVWQSLTLWWEPFLPYRTKKCEATGKALMRRQEMCPVQVRSFCKSLSAYYIIVRWNPIQWVQCKHLFLMGFFVVCPEVQVYSLYI